MKYIRWREINEFFIFILFRYIVIISVDGKDMVIIRFENSKKELIFIYYNMKYLSILLCKNINRLYDRNYFKIWKVFLFIN